MKKLILFVLAALFLSGICFAQNLPAINVYGGFSYYSFDVPGSTVTSSNSQRLAMNGYGFGASVNLFHHLGADGDFSHHSASDCLGNTGFNCTNFSYMFGPRYNFGEGKLTGFVHGLIGQDQMNIVVSGAVQSDTSVAIAAGGGVDYWFMRHIGVQLGPADFVYTRHLNEDTVPSQNNFRVAAGVVFRFGGELPAAESKSAPAPASAPTSRRSRREGRSAGTVAAAQPAGVVNIPGRGLSISSLGAVFAPQEFEGAKIVEVAPGGVAEMASLKVGDLVKAVDSRAVRTPMELAAELSDKSGKVHITIQRGDAAIETQVLLGR
ncbi:MAG: outer membrane beta-barrel protein [Terriglobales bacterium]